MAWDVAARQMEPVLQVARQLRAVGLADRHHVEEPVGRSGVTVEEDVRPCEPDVEDLDGKVLAGDVVAVDLDPPPGRPCDGQLLLENVQRLVHLTADERMPDADLPLARQQLREESAAERLDEPCPSP